ncbi:G-protein coupled estrogen receptor 1-like isoform X1 [Cyprinodon tularosa]|uniref:G-protein coupled estrogen receptor 1-like isoform X1 n=1 Tax=Cyprinodon tularosa TaxID=77115 RepID=UPI0018E21810|nr:G-protein coupled estrogen receptor 1-like isoform X1 [Cyprinodon tularosa]
MFMEHRITAGENLTLQSNDTQLTTGVLQTSSENAEHYLINILISGFYTIILFPIGLVGNILILVVNLHHKGRLTAPDLYFVNLAAADLILVADSLIEVFNLKKGYYDNTGLCTFMNLFQQVNLYSSVFFLTWMSIDRFIALTCVNGTSMGHARLSCCFIWVFSSVLTLLPFAVAQVQHSGELHFCFANVSQIQWLEVTLGFLLPFCILGVCYWRIGQVLRRSQREQCNPQQRPRRQRALRMISAAVLVFFICWLPVNVFISIHLLKGDTDSSSTLWELYPLTGHAVRLAAFSNSCLNPLIYGFLGETFRRKLRLFLREKSRSPKLSRSVSERAMYATVSPNCPPTTWDTSNDSSSSTSESRHRLS